MDFIEWHDEQLNGDADMCPHKEWEHKAWNAATEVEKERCAMICENFWPDGDATAAKKLAAVIRGTANERTER